MKTGVIIVAGGSGTRMGTEIPKQFLLLDGEPLLMHTIRRFQAAIPDIKIVLVLPESHLVHWAALCEEYGFHTEHWAVGGGETRFHSVKNGLEKASDCDYIGVHDGVRPLVSTEVVVHVLESAQKCGAAIPVVPLSDSLRELVHCDECQNVTQVIDSNPVDRNRFVAVQTPQFFLASILRKAYEQEYRAGFTDDASVVESAGYTVTLVSGDHSNIKVTTPTDLALAGVLIKQ